jgi:hypothetical protein
MVQTMCYLLEGLLAQLSDLKRTGSVPEGSPLEKEIFEAIFVFCVIWAFGGGMCPDKTHDCKS